MLGLTLSLEAYSVLSPTAFAAPPHPGAAPIFLHAANYPQISNTRRVFSEEEAVYQRFNIVVKALNALLKGAFEKIFFESLSAPYVGLATRLPIDILNHIYALYAVISTADLSENYNRLKSKFDINLPIEGLFWQIQEAIYFSDTGRAP